jgi:hypothetical protein
MTRTYKYQVENIVSKLNEMSEINDYSNLRKEYDGHNQLRWCVTQSQPNGNYKRWFVGDTLQKAREKLELAYDYEKEFQS